MMTKAAGLTIRPVSSARFAMRLNSLSLQKKFSIG